MEFKNLLNIYFREEYLYIAFIIALHFLFSAKKKYVDIYNFFVD